jgi:hypothetical protein
MINKNVEGRTAIGDRIVIRHIALLEEEMNEE